jgi:hypothetical protein
MVDFDLLLCWLPCIRLLSPSPSVSSEQAWSGAQPSGDNAIGAALRLSVRRADVADVQLSCGFVCVYPGFRAHQYPVGGSAAETVCHGLGARGARVPRWLLSSIRRKIYELLGIRVGLFLGGPDSLLFGFGNGAEHLSGRIAFGGQQRESGRTIHPNSRRMLCRLRTGAPGNILQASPRKE